ncbi:MAG: hypothetical protein V3U79_00965, partial [Dehalococcoidia bacterium]
MKDEKEGCMARLSLPLFLSLAFTFLTAFVLSHITASEVTAQTDECNGAFIHIEGGEPSPFIVPTHGDNTLRVEPDGLILISVEDQKPPPQQREVSLTVVGFGFDLDKITREIDPAPDSTPVEINLDDELPSYARGLYKVEATLIDDGTEICTVEFDLRVGGFGGVIATASTATAAVAGAGALASSALASNGMNAKLKLKVQLRRRRPRGLVRFLPIPAWKRTIFSTFIGAITGLALTVVLQQAGATPMSVLAGVWGLIAGGGLTFGVGYSLGVLRMYLKP